MCVCELYVTWLLITALATPVFMRVCVWFIRRIKREPVAKQLRQHLYSCVCMCAWIVRDMTYDNSSGNTCLHLCVCVIHTWHDLFNQSLNSSGNTCIDVCLYVIHMRHDSFICATTHSRKTPTSRWTALATTPVFMCVCVWFICRMKPFLQSSGYRNRPLKPSG